MTPGDRIFALYRNGQPQEAAIKAALAAAMVALVRLRGRADAAAIFQTMAVGIGSGRLGGPVEPKRPVVTHSTTGRA